MFVLWITTVCSKQESKTGVVKHKQEEIRINIHVNVCRIPIHKWDRRKENSCDGVYMYLFGG